MRIEVLSGSPRTSSLTRRIAIHLFNRFGKEKELSVGLIDIRDHQWGAVENIYQAPGIISSDRSDVVRRMFDADAVVLVTPEYNGSYSPALKNFLDHFPKQTEKVFGIVTGSPGSFGGIRAALQLQTLIYGLMGIGSPQMLIVPEIDSKFQEDGTLINDNFKQSVDSFVERFIWLSRAINYSRAMNVVKKPA